MTLLLVSCEEWAAVCPPACTRDASQLTRASFVWVRRQGFAAPDWPDHCIFALQPRLLASPLIFCFFFRLKSGRLWYLLFLSSLGQSLFKLPGSSSIEEKTSAHSLFFSPSPPSLILKQPLHTSIPNAGAS
ncbi:hypothetical protein BJX62DRAFT_85922 [Aspergillus germanicus]